MTTPNEEFDFEKMMEERIQDTYAPTSASASEQAAQQKLKEMNKKLPSWNLEPPYTFLK